jgi:hypothetical protein
VSHFWAENGLRPATHRPYSPDLAPSDFFLSAYLRHRLQGLIFPSREELLAGIREVLGAIPLETLAHVFDHWMERLEWVFQNNGGYYPSAKDSLIELFFFPIRDRDAKPEWNTLYMDRAGEIGDRDVQQIRPRGPGTPLVLVQRSRRNSSEMKQDNPDLDRVGFRIDGGLFDGDGWHRGCIDKCTAETLDGTD